MTESAHCPLCDGDGGHLVFCADRFRVVRADEEGFLAFYRVIWNEHVREFSDLALADRVLCMEAVARVERVLRDHLAPTKINLAALGNMVPHLHWHVIARFDWDSHFPAPVWAPAQREADTVRTAQLMSRRLAVEEALAAALAGASGNRTPA